MRIAEQMKIYGYLRPREWKILESVSLIEVKSVSSYTLARIRLYSGFHLCTNIYVFFSFFFNTNRGYTLAAVSRMHSVLG